MKRNMYAWHFEWDREDQLDEHEHHDKVKRIISIKRNMSVARYILWVITSITLVVAFYLTCMIHPRWLPFYHPFHLNYSHLSSSYQDWSIGQQLASIHNYLFGNRSETEGWYIKFHLPAHYSKCQKDDHTSSDGSEQQICEFAVIFLWYTDPQPERSHSSIQFYDATNLRNHMYRRPLESFHSDPLPSVKDFLHQLDQTSHNGSETFINVGNNISLFIDHNKFSLLSTQLDVAPEPGDNTRSHIKLNVQLRPGDALPLTTSTSTFFSPLSHTVGILGFLPLSCFQQMIAMKLDVLEGFLDIDGELVDLTGSEAYVEKTWGRSFPKEYLWMHATKFSDANSPVSDPSINHSQSRITSLFFSVADVPVLGSVSWPGFVSTLLFDGRYLHFASHLGSVISMTHSDSNRVVIRLYDQSFRHEVVIELDRAQDVDEHSDAWLYAAKDGSMQKIIKQQIGRDECTVTLNELIINQLIDHSTDQSSPDEFTFHNYSRQLLAKARTRATGLEVMVEPDGRLVKLIDEIYGSMRPWLNNWFKLNTRLISLSMSTSALYVAWKLALENLSQIDALRWFLASGIVAVSVLVLRRSRLST